MIALTEFGDPAVLLPLAFVLLLWLLRLPTRDAALWWVVALALCIGGTVLLKIYFYGCVQDGQLHNPSGHASLATLVYGGFAIIVVKRGVYWQQLTIVSGVVALVLGIAASRIVLNTHTSLEVGLGLIIGILSLAVFAGAYPRLPTGNPPFRSLFLVTLLVAIALHGNTLRAEEFLHRLSTYAHVTPIVCL
jgi:membrane-associated phospholipid phosphatase